MSQFVKSFLVVLSVLMLVAVATGCSRSSGSVRSSTGGAVTIDVEWVSPDGAPLIFKVEMNTHSVDLDQYDLSRLTILRDDAGNEYRPLSWGSAPGGHHRTGTLTFPVPDSLTQGKARYIEMVIRDIAGVEERVLRWEL